MKTPSEKAGKGTQGKPRAALGKGGAPQQRGRATRKGKTDGKNGKDGEKRRKGDEEKAAPSRARPVAASPLPAVSSAAEAEERDALARRRRLEWRAVQEAIRRREARAHLPRVPIVCLLQQMLAADCERQHLSARGAAQVCGLSHPTANVQWKGEGKGYCDSLDKLIDGLVEDEVVLLERLIQKIKAERQRQG